MKIPEIKRLVGTYSIKELEDAETAILEGETPIIDIEGADEGEELTHALAAKEILVSMEKEGLTFPQALRHYSQRVRKSIS